MGARVVEAIVRTGRWGPTRRIRIDLHGISTFGPGAHHTLIRWEQLTAITADSHGVTVISPRVEIVLPRGIFDTEPTVLAEKLELARSIFNRGEILAELSGPAEMN